MSDYRDDYEAVKATLAERDKRIAYLERNYARVRAVLSEIAYAFVVTEEAILIMKKMAREALEKGEL